mgnify:FL=1
MLHLPRSAENDHHTKGLPAITFPCLRHHFPIATKLIGKEEIYIKMSKDDLNLNGL